MKSLSETVPRFNNSADAHTKALSSVQMMLRSASGDKPLFPPTLLYNEGWLLRLVLDWFARHSIPDHPLAFAAEASWFSEALLPSAFLARYHGDKLAENWTHADGVIGHIQIGDKGKADLKLLPEAKQFLVLEAKVFSGLTRGVTHASYFDQAARTVACMAEVLHRANYHPSTLTTLGFYVLAPKDRIEQGVFDKTVNRASLIAKAERRAGEYAGEKVEWFSQWFQPTWEMISIQCLSWEEVITAIKESDSSAGASIDLFYNFCLSFGK